MLNYARISCDRFSRFDLCCVALAVAEGECVHGVALVLRDGEHGGRIESAAEKEDGGRSSGGRFQRRASASKSKVRQASRGYAAPAIATRRGRSIVIARLRSSRER